MLTLKDFEFDITQNGFFQFFGNPGQGKTAVLIEFASHSALNGKKVIFIDCSAQISMKRFKAYLSPQAMQNIVFFLPKSLKKLLMTVDNLELLRIYTQSCVCVDNIFYHDSEKPSNFEDEKQLKYYAYIFSVLSRISSECPVFLTNNSVKHSSRVVRPFNEYITSKWVQCSFFLWKKKAEIYLENMG
ncbi:MAG: hypothetical protein ACXAEU_14680 [Candidatus Hodarchaeales archaeon]|jgi:RecA/RadA recombinase